jgi:FkbH-like protein
MRFRLKLNRLTSPDDGWGGRLHLVADRPENREHRLATLSLAVQPPGKRRGDAPPGEPPPPAHVDAPRPRPTNGPVEPMLGDDHDNFRYRAPRDLAMSPTPLRRILVIGSCLAGGLPEYVRTASPGCPADYILFNNMSELPAAPPLPPGEYDFQVVQVPIRSVLPDYAYFRAPADAAAWQRVFDDACERVEQLLDAAMRWNTEHGLLSFVANFMLPQQNAYGRLLGRYDLSNPVHMVERLNQHLYEEVRKRANAYVLDIDSIAATFGRKFIQDDSVWQLNHGAVLGDNDFALDQARIAPVPPVSRHHTLRGFDFMQAQWAEIVAMYRTVRQIDAVKLVIVDLDDTLWRGVAAEQDDHAADAVEGWPLGLIEALGFLKRRGVLLAIVSKNDDAKVAKFWDNILMGRLTMDDFAVRRINWEPKADNIDAIIREVNVLPRSVVFVDDNPVERAAVQAALPDIRVLGANQYYLRRILLWAPETQVPVVTDESARRTEMIQAAGERETTRKRLSRPEFLASLGLRVRVMEIIGPDHKSYPRAFELINKTNQFNTTGKRWTQEAMRAALAAGTVLHAFEVEDRFSQYGLVGVVIAAPGRIEQMVMSCRVVGLDVEIAAMAAILRRMREAGADAVSTRLIETDANLLCRNLFERCGFTAEPDGAWVSRPQDALAVPAHIAMV